MQSDTGSFAISDFRLGPGLTDVRRTAAETRVRPKREPHAPDSRIAWLILFILYGIVFASHLFAAQQLAGQAPSLGLLAAHGVRDLLPTQQEVGTGWAALGLRHTAE